MRCRGKLVDESAGDHGVHCSSKLQIQASRGRCPPEQSHHGNASKMQPALALLMVCSVDMNSPIFPYVTIPAARPINSIKPIHALFILPYPVIDVAYPVAFSSESH
ncbi:uncharacterized protein UV8b_07320 [Ustilaginoidea virens]|uniref:Uncharacterized protein n=1 Tax=Ustilaginoidea virens TaxID=1159556 RepID=A0A8E5HWW8_USTVR|nr:uncharacterized protein UV8b_07320 [Ustilaginoidea virens]QUC23079.1 hypothetical protein UV8b_07320 [Ustilaginoidea virens]